MGLFSVHKELWKSWVHCFIYICINCLHVWQRKQEAPLLQQKQVSVILWLTHSQQQLLRTSTAFRSFNSLLGIFTCSIISFTHWKWVTVNIFCFCVTHKRFNDFTKLSRHPHHWVAKKTPNLFFSTYIFFLTRTACYLQNEEKKFPLFWIGSFNVLKPCSHCPLLIVSQWFDSKQCFSKCGPLRSSIRLLEM